MYSSLVVKNGGDPREDVLGLRSCLGSAIMKGQSGSPAELYDFGRTSYPAMAVGSRHMPYALLRNLDHA